MADIFPAAPGFRNIGAESMRYIPELFAGKVLTDYYERTVLGAITNRDYEGEFRKMGDKIWIRTAPHITIRNWQKGQNIVVEQPESVARTMQIDQAKYWAFVSEPLDEKQTDIKSYVDMWKTAAAKDLEQVLDSDILQYMWERPSPDLSGATAGKRSKSINLGTLSTPKSVRPNALLDLLVDVSTALRESLIPRPWFFVMPPAVAGHLMKSDLRSAAYSGDSKSLIRTGSLGSLMGFELYETTLLPSLSSGEPILFGTRDATSYAMQLTETDISKNPFGFGTVFKGLVVYGREVIRPECLGRAVVTLDLS